MFTFCADGADWLGIDCPTFCLGDGFFPGLGGMMEDSPADTTQNSVLSQPTGRTLDGPPSYVTKEGLTDFQEKVFKVYG